MRAILDKLNGLVILKLLRGYLGLRPGEVKVTAESPGLRMGPLVDDSTPTLTKERPLCDT